MSPWMFVASHLYALAKNEHKEFVHGSYWVNADGHGTFIIKQGGKEYRVYLGDLSVSDNRVEVLLQERLSELFMCDFHRMDEDEFLYRLHQINYDWKKDWGSNQFQFRFNGYFFDITENERQALIDNNATVNQVLQRALIMEADFESMNWLMLSSLLRDYTNS